MSVPAFADRLLDAFVIRQWTQDSGLPGSQVADLEPGPDGFLWLACGDALYRFDGAAADLLLRLPPTNQSVSAFAPLDARSAYVSSLTDVYLCGGAGSLAGGHLLGPELGANLDFARLTNGAVWGFAQEGLVRYDGARAARFPAPGASAHSPATRFHGGCADSRGNLWLVSQSRVVRFDPRSERYEDVPAPEVPEPSAGGFERIFAGLDGRVWLYLHPCHLFAYEPERGWRAVDTGFTPEQRLGIRTLLETDDSSVWFGTENAVYRLRDGSRDELTAADLGTPLYPSALQPSQAGGVWIALRGAGLLHLRPRAVTMLRAEGLSGPQAFYALFARPDGELLAGIAGHGLVAGPPERLSQGLQTPMLRDASVAAVLPTSGDELWFATLGHYLICQRGGAETVASIESAAPLPTWNVTSLARTPGGELWASSPSGLFYVQDGWPPVLRVVTQEPCALVFASRAGTLYAACGPRLSEVNPTSKRLAPLAAAPSDRAIRALVEDREGRLWAGTTRGLYRFDAAARALVPAPGEWHQPGRCVNQILQSRDGRLWLGTREGIIRLGNAPGDAARLYNQADGMETTECTGGFAPAGLALADGRLLFPTLNGLACVDPERLSHATSPTVRPVIAESPAALPAGTRSATFRFSALPVAEGLYARFSWQLDDEPWSEPSAGRNASFGRLTPGSHRLSVRALDREGVRSAALVHDFAVRPLIWQSPIFRLASLLLALGFSGAVAAALTRRRAQLKLRRLARERALDLERARIARDLHDDIGAGLTRMAMLSAQGRYIPEMPQAANDLNARIFSAARETSRALNEIVWAANPEKDDTEHVATYLALYAENFLRDAGLRSRVLIAPDIPAARLPPSVRHPLFRAVKEALSNAAKHARASVVTLEVRVRGDALVVVVADDGQGFDPAAVKTGNGLSFMRARLAEIGGALDLEAAPGRGARLTFTLPLRAGEEPRPKR